MKKRLNREYFELDCQFACSYAIIVILSYAERDNGQTANCCKTVPRIVGKTEQVRKKTGTSKTDVVVGALAQYLGCAEALPLNQKIAELEARIATVEALVKVR